MVVVVGAGFYYDRKINSFVCKSDCNPQVSQALEVLVKTRVRLAPAAVAELLKNQPEIGNFTVTEKGWGNLQLLVVKKKPLFSVKKGGWYYHYDWDGRFVEKTKEQKFVFLEARSFDNSVLNGLRLLFFFTKLESTYTAQIIDDSLLVSTPETVVKFPLEDDYQLLITKYYYIKNNMLSEVKKSLVVNSETPITMDLRYLRPIAFKNE